MTQIELLRSIEFHDLPVRGIRFEFDFNHQSFVLDFATYDDDRECYVEWTLQLKDLVQFASTEIELASDSDPEIYSFELAAEDPFKGTLLFLTGHGKREFSINFECRSFILAERQ